MDLAYLQRGAVSFREGNFIWDEVGWLIIIFFQNFELKHILLTKLDAILVESKDHSISA